MTQSRATFLGLAGSYVAMRALPALADTYPDRPIRLVIGFPPGGPSDILARVVAQGLSQRLGQAVIVDNRPGAGGNVAGAIAAKAQPDGYTLLMGNLSILVANPSLYKNVSFDPNTDFVPISLIGSETNILVVNPSLPVQSVKDLVALAKAQPGKINFASSGFGSPPYLTAEMFMATEHVDLVHVPYSGAASALAEVVSGQTQMMFATALSVMPFIKSGQLRAIAVSTAHRSSLYPKLPTVAESGVPGFDATTWHGLVAPAKTPRDVLTKLEAATVAVLHEPAVARRLAALGLTVIASNPQQFSAYIKTEQQRWTKAIKASGAHVE
jgi:tripartite-type tricarboxylate transporter receptor subunit TctC